MEYIEIGYAYPTSERARECGHGGAGCYYVAQMAGYVSRHQFRIVEVLATRADAMQADADYRRGAGNSEGFAVSPYSFQFEG